MARQFLVRSMRRLLLTVLTLTALLPAVKALAGGGDHWYAVADLAATNYGSSDHGMPFLSPANDTRINLFLLYADQRGWPVTLEPHSLEQSSNNPLPFVLFFDRSSHWFAQQHALERDILQLRELAEPWVEQELLRQLEMRSDGWFQGYCQYNSVFAANDFLAALHRAQQNQQLSEAAHRALATTRVQMTWRCADTLQSITIPELSDEAEDFSRYLQAARYFYLDELNSAAALFAQLQQSSQPWVAEAATYMTARSSLRLAQQPAEQTWYFDRSQVDAEHLAASAALYQAYLQRYPQGRYAASAEGLFQRIYWLQNDTTALGEIYAGLLDTVEREELSSLLNDVWRYYLVELDRRMQDEPTDEQFVRPEFVLAYQLRQLRSNNYPPRELPASVLEPSQAYAHFAAQPTLSERAEALLAINELAYRLYHAGQPEQVLADTPAQSPSAPDLLTFTAQVYRGIALQQLARWDEAETHWRQLYDAAGHYTQQAVAETGLAVALERNNRLEVMFAADSLVQNLSLRWPVLTQIAPPAVLEQVIANPALTINERSEAMRRLLSQHLARGQYTEFLHGLDLLAADTQLHNLLPLKREDTGYACPTAAELGQQLEQLARQSTALSARQHNCVGDLLAVLARPLYTSPGHYALELPESYYRHLRPDTLVPGAGPDRFPGPPPASVLSHFMAAIEFGPTAGDDRAYALYRAVNCYVRAANRCGDEEIDLDVRSRWFYLLKTRHGNTSWAQRQRYYW